MEIKFLKHMLQPQPTPKGVYLGIGCVGSDGVEGDFSFSLVLFLWLAEQVRRHFGVPKAQILLMDLPNGRAVDTARKERLLAGLLSILKMQNWEIVKYSQLFGSWPHGASYEEVQSQITDRMLFQGGYQVGWVYPAERPGMRDELYFAKYFLEKYRRKDVGFALGLFPPLIPGGIVGSPYLVRPTQKSHRLLLLENEESCRRKFTGPDGKLAPVSTGNGYPVMNVLREAGVVTGMATRRELTEQLVNGIAALAANLRQTL